MLVNVYVSIVQFLSDSRHSILIQSMILLEHGCFSVARRWLLRRISHDVHGSVGVLLQIGLVPAHVHGPSETSVQRSTVQNDRILNIVARVTHDGDLRVLTSWQLLEVTNLECLRLDEGLLRVSQQVK